MCQGCWIDHGMPVLADDDTLATALLVGRLYAMPGCSTGGPLHWMLDDMNLDDDQFGERDPIGYWHGLFDYLDDGRYDRWASASPAEKAEIVHLSEAILVQLADMPEGQRAAVVAWAFGWIAADMPEYAARVRTQERMERVEEYAEELLDKARALPPIEERGYEPVESKACVPVACPPFQEVNFADYYAPLFANGSTVQLADVPEELRPLAEQYIQEHAPRITQEADHVAVERRGIVDGVLHPGYGMRFAPDAQITGPFDDIKILPDGSARVSGLRVNPSGLLDVGPPMFGPVVPGDDAKPTFKWAEYTVTREDGTTENVRWDAETIAQATTPPRVDLDEVLRQQPPQVTYSHEE